MNRFKAPLAVWRAAQVIALAGALAVSLAACAPKGPAVVGPRLALDAPLPNVIPPGTRLVIGDPTTQKVLEHTGWIRELPFQVEWAQITGGPAVTEAFHARALDVGAAANIPPIHAAWAGIPVKMIAVRLRADPLEHPLFELGIAPGAKIASLADLKGKKIAFSPGQVQGEVVLRTLAAEGLTPKDVSLVELPSTGDVYPNALASRQVDVAPLGAGVVAQRYLAAYGKDGARVLRHAPFRDDLTDLYVRVETLQDPAKAAALKAYVKLWARAGEWVRTHPDEWAQVYYVQNQGLPAADAHRAVAAAGAAVQPTDWGEAIRLQQASINFLAPQVGRQPFDASTLFDRRFEAVAAEASGRQVASARPAASAGPAPGGRSQ